MATSLSRSDPFIDFVSAELPQAPYLMSGHLLAVGPLIHSVSFDPEVLGYLVDREPSVFNHLTFPWQKPGGQLLPTVNNREANHEEKLSN